MRRSRAGLRQALLDLLQVRPLDQVTIRDIAAQAGVGYTTYFRHYPSKEALLEDVAAAEIEGLLALVNPVWDAVDNRAACSALCAHVEANRAVWTALLTGGAASAIRDELLGRSREAAASRRAYPDWLPAELGLTLGVGATVEILAWWLRQAEPVPAEQVAEMLYRVAISPTQLNRAG